MSFTMRGAKPQTFRYDVTSAGGQYFLGSQSAEIIFRPQSGSGQLFWDAASFNAGTNFVELNGDAYSGEFRVRASVECVWLTGPMEIEITVLGQG